MGARFNDWLLLARRVQDEVYGIRPVDLTDDAWIESVKMNTLCAHTELSEALQELDWKDWRGPVGRPGIDARERAVTELIDSLCHISNLLNLLGVDDHELNVRYADKVDFTRKRDLGVGDRKETE